MDRFKETKRQSLAKNYNLFPKAVSVEEKEEASRNSTREHLFVSNKTVLAAGERHPQQPELQGSLIIQRKAADHYKNGREAMGKSQYEKAVICFSKAITLQPEQTLYVGKAEAYLQLCDFQSAAICYKQASLFEPNAFNTRLAFIYFVQGQCLFDQGLFKEALEAFSKATELKPGCRAYEVKSVLYTALNAVYSSLACLTAAGHYSDCLKLVNDWMLTDGPTSDLHILRARLYKLLNQTSQCYHDARSALVLNPTSPEGRALLLQLQEASEQARQKAVDRSLTGQLPEALCMINIALENCPLDAHLYLFRGILYRRLKDFTAAIEDLVQAVELNEEEDKEVSAQAEARKEKDGPDSVQEEARFQLVLTYNDFAVQCFSRGLYAEATLLLNKAIEEEKGQAGLYLNRGDCFFKQGDWCFALADYQQAEEMMRPEDPAVRLRLAVLHNTLGLFHFQDGHFQKAADMFSLAIRYNPAASQYYENRSKTFRKLLNLKPAREDLICMLILDPNNQELPPMVMHLFPGCSISKILSSSEGQAVRVQLMDNIQACSSSSNQQRLSDMLQRMTYENTASQSEEPSEVGKELKLCANQQEMQLTAKSLLQTEAVVSKVSP